MSTKVSNNDTLTWLDWDNRPWDSSKIVNLVVNDAQPNHLLGNTRPQQNYAWPAPHTAAFPSHTHTTLHQQKHLPQRIAPHSIHCHQTRLQTTFLLTKLRSTMLHFVDSHVCTSDQLIEILSQQKKHIQHHHTPQHQHIFRQRKSDAHINLTVSLLSLFHSFTCSQDIYFSSSCIYYPIRVIQAVCFTQPQNTN